MSAPPRVSVVVPTYERREWVCRAAQSVFAQRYRDWELIVVDDGSTDGTAQALRAFGPRLRVVRLEQNHGVSGARNAGLRVARGDLVAFLDSDDRWLPDHLETVTSMLDRHPEAVLATTTPAFAVAGRSRPDASRLVSVVPDIFFCNLIGYPTSVAVRSNVLSEVGGFDEQLEVGEDGELFLRLALRGPFATLQRRTIVHQHTAGSLIERAGRRLAFVDAWRLMARRAHEAARDGEFAQQAAASVAYVEGLAAVLDGATKAARQHLEDATAAWPRLSRSPMMILKRLENVLWEPDERLRALSTAAAAWPDPASDTALFLRVRTLALALRLGRLRLAASIADDWPARTTPAFLHRTAHVWAALGRRYVQSRVYCGAESEALASSSSRSRCSSWAIRSSSSS